MTLRDRATVLAFKAAIKHRQLVDYLGKHPNIRARIIGAVLEGKTPEEIQKVISGYTGNKDA